MTERLYYNDSTSLDFEAQILRAETRGDRQAIWLDRSAFYPTTGGQPFDTGTLDDRRVVDVFEEDDDVVHLAEGVPFEIGSTVRGVVDWQRRFDHMQQHTGQHVLSAAFVRVRGVKTVSFHLGSDVSTIDLDREVTPADIGAAEVAANGVVWEDRLVTVRYTSAGDAAALPLRKTPSRTGTLRLVDITDWDLSACGGTHVARTGEVGLIAVSGWERFKGGLRVSFVCGGRALKHFGRLRDLTTASVRLLSVLPDDIPSGIERLLADAREQKRTAGALQTELARYKAEELAATADALGLVVATVEGDANTLKALATATAGRAPVSVVLVSTSTPALIVAARAKDGTLACDALVKTIAGQFGGRGGGKPDLAQAGGLNGSGDAILDAVRAYLRN